MLENHEIGLGNHGENTFCVQENVEKRGILGGRGASRGLSWAQVGCKCPRRAPAKRGDLRAYLGSVEGLYPLEGESAPVVKMWLCEGVGLPRLCTPFEGEVAELRVLVGPKNLRNFFRGRFPYKRPPAFHNVGGLGKRKKLVLCLNRA